jgi:beta-mannosidase
MKVIVMRMKTVLLLNFSIWLLMIFPLSLSAAGMPVKQILNRNWEFFYSHQWYSTQVPFSIHTDLFGHGLVADPLAASQKTPMGWIDSVSWKYRKVFRLDAALQSKKNVDLVFEGIDTYADVYLNGVWLFRASGMFRPWRIAVKHLLKTDNQIEVVFYPAALIVDSLYRLHPIGRTSASSHVMVRKAQYHFGCDFSYCFVTCGLWLDVYLEGYEDFCIPYLSVITDSISADRAYLQAAITFYSHESMPVVVLASLAGSPPLIATEVQCMRGEHTLFIPFVIHQPRLWWCHGVGEQPLYEIHFECTGSNGQSIVKRIKTGIRTFQYIEQMDSASGHFLFRLNNRPLWLKGAYYVPQDMFLNRVSTDQYRQLLTEVKNCGMNWLRVTGAGIYEKTVFYELCDSLGILLWQDFMLQGSHYPADSVFLTQLKQEAMHQVLRLNAHPSVVLWCGPGYDLKNPPDDEPPPLPDSLSLASCQHAFRKIYTELFPSVVKSFSALNYLVMPPMFCNGSGPNDVNDSFLPANTYSVRQDTACRIVILHSLCEVGFLSLPAIETLRLLHADSVHLNKMPLSPLQPWSGNIEIINARMQKRFGKVPARLEEYVTLSQQLQAEVIGAVIQSHQKSPGHCPAMLLRQLNDSWPAVSSSIIDYYGRKKKIFPQICEVFSRQ